MVARWAHGPVVSVSYQRPPANGQASYWDETIVLLRLDGGDQARVSALLAAKLNYNFISFAGARVAPLAFSTTARGEPADFGDLVVTANGLYQITGADRVASASEAFVSSFSTSVFTGLQLVPPSGVADVTGYSRVSLTGPSSGPVTVEVQGQQVDALAATIDGLPSGPSPYCHEDELPYQVVFRPSPSAPPSYEAFGHGCEAAVLVSVEGRSLVPRQDTHCALFDAVVRILPASAAGTLHSDPECSAPTVPPKGTVSRVLEAEGGPRGLYSVTGTPATPRDCESYSMELAPPL
jgi:hypothetical protein